MCTSIEEASEKPLDIFKTSNKKGLEHLQTSSLSPPPHSLTFSPSHFLSLSLTYYLSLFSSPLSTLSPLPLPLSTSLHLSFSANKRFEFVVYGWTTSLFKSDYVMLDQALRYLITGVKWLKKTKLWRLRTLTLANRC